VVSIRVTGRHLDRLPARAGQFFIWRFPGHHRWWQANPFSLSAAPDGRSLRLTVKASGPTSAALRHLPVGTRLFAEGPYGPTRSCSPSSRTSPAGAVPGCTCWPGGPRRCPRSTRAPCSPGCPTSATATSSSAGHPG
jgi:hypothetical protein